MFVEMAPLRLAGRLWFATGFSALAIALVSALYTMGIDGRPDDVILDFEGQRVGSWRETLASLGIALVFWRPQFARVGTRSSPGSSEPRPFDRPPQCLPVVAEKPYSNRMEVHVTPETAK